MITSRRWPRNAAWTNALGDSESRDTPYASTPNGRFVRLRRLRRALRATDQSGRFRKAGGARQYLWPWIRSGLWPFRTSPIFRPRRSTRSRA
jgi:hypothetical protein